MIRIYAHTENEEQADACYGAFLTDTIPQSGWILTEGAHLYLLDRKPAIPEGEGLAVSEGPVDFISTTLPAAKARAAYGAYLSGRRLPAGCALAAGEGMISIFPASSYAPDLGEMEIYRLPFDPLEEVVTPKEAADLYGADAKRVQADCERAGEGGLFSLSEVRRSGNTYLILRQSAERVYGGKKDGRLPFPLNPLLLVFSTVEAARLWNRDSGAVRSAAAGAGHASARMTEGERRKSGRTWLVTRDAMDRLFGQALPAAMKEAMKWIR